MSIVRQPPRIGNFKHKSRPKIARRDTNPEHLAFIRTLPCLVNEIWCQGNIEAHHLLGLPDNSRGGALKAADYWATPLCRKHHTRLHEIGERTFFSELGITYPPAIAALLYVLSGNETACLRAIHEARWR